MSSFPIRPSALRQPAVELAPRAAGEARFDFSAPDWSRAELLFAARRAFVGLVHGLTIRTGFEGRVYLAIGDALGITDHKVLLLLREGRLLGVVEGGKRLSPVTLSRSGRELLEPLGWFELAHASGTDEEQLAAALEAWPEVNEGGKLPTTTGSPLVTATRSGRK